MGVKRTRPKKEEKLTDDVSHKACCILTAPKNTMLVRCLWIKMLVRKCSSSSSSNSSSNIRAIRAQARALHKSTRTAAIN